MLRRTEERVIRGILISANNWVQEVCFLCDHPIHLGKGPHEAALQEALRRLPQRLFYPHQTNLGGQEAVKDRPGLRCVRVQTCKRPGFVMVQLDMPRKEDDNHLGFCILKNQNMQFLNGPALVVASPGRGPCNPDLRFGEFLSAFQEFFPDKLKWEQKGLLDLRPPLPGAAAKGIGKERVGGPLLPKAARASAQPKGEGKALGDPSGPNASAASAQPKGKGKALDGRSAQNAQSDGKGNSTAAPVLQDSPMDPCKWLSLDAISTPSGGSSGSSSVEELDDELPSPRSMRTEHVGIFISRLDPTRQDADTRQRYTEYAELLVSDGYDGTSLRLVTEDDLKELGIKGGAFIVDVLQVILKAITDLYAAYPPLE